MPCDAARRELVGVLAWLATHPRDRCPWIGCIVLRADRQRQGVGREVLRALEHLLAEEGRERVRASPLIAQPGARAFLESLGYSPIGEGLDQDTRRCMIMEKVLIAQTRSGFLGMRARLVSAVTGHPLGHPRRTTARARARP